MGGGGALVQSLQKNFSIFILFLQKGQFLKKKTRKTIRADDKW